MVVVMAPDATDEDVAHVVERSRASAARRSSARAWCARSSAWSATSTPSTTSTCAPCRGSRTCTASPTRTSWSAASTTPSARTVWVGPAGHQVPIGPDTFTFIAGPCAVESEQQTARGRADGQGRRRHDHAWRRLQAAHLAVRLPGARRRAASRSWPASARPPGCRWSPRSSTPATSPWSPSTPTCSRSAPATWRTSGCCRPSATSGKPVLLKRGMTATIEEWLMAAEYIAQRGNLDIVLCERGIRTFEPATRNTLDISAIPVVQATSHLPIIVDPSHAAGRSDLVVPLSRAAVAVGADGVIVDVHPDPEDGALRRAAGAARQRPALAGPGRTTAARGRRTGVGREPHRRGDERASGYRSARLAYADRREPRGGDMGYCTNCGAALVVGRFCTSCGAPTGAPTTATTPEQPGVAAARPSCARRRARHRAHQRTAGRPRPCGRPGRRPPPAYTGQASADGPATRSTPTRSTPDRAVPWPHRRRPDDDRTARSFPAWRRVLAVVVVLLVVGVGCFALTRGGATPPPQPASDAALGEPASEGDPGRRALHPPRQPAAPRRPRRPTRPPPGRSRSRRAGTWRTR